MNCIIIEDQPPAQRILQKYIEEYGHLQLKGIFPDALQAIDFLKSQSIDLIFLDIHLPKISGIDFLKTLPQKPQIILTTAFPDYALESYELDVVDYLLKPFSFPRFVQAISKVARNKTMSSEKKVNIPANEVYMKSGHDHVRIVIDEISYIQSDTDYTEVHLAKSKILTSESLRNWLEILPDDHFVRVHKSYIVNTSHIRKVSGNELHLKQDVIIPIGRAFKETFIERFIK